MVTEDVLIDEIANRLVALKNGVVLTGAGISTPSGIPDFRSANGLWSRFDPNVYARYDVFLRDPAKYWTMAKVTTPLVLGARPNVIHDVIAELEAMRCINTVITQNIDFLHHKAGSKNVLEIHGTYRTLTCQRCREKVLRESIVAQLDSGRIPPLHDCGGVLAPDIIMFDQMLDPATINNARNATVNCSTMLVVGSSLEVSPANLLPVAAKQAGAKVFMFNNAPTLFDDDLDGVVLGAAERTLPALLDRVKKKRIENQEHSGMQN